MTSTDDQSSLRSAPGPELDLQAPIVEARPPTSKEQFYLDWALESPKTSLALLNDVMKTLLTLAASLLGGSIAFLGDDVIQHQFKLAVVICFFFALLISFLGVIPVASELSENEPAAIGQSKYKALRLKWTLFCLSAFAFLIGFGIAIAGIFVKWWG